MKLILKTDVKHLGYVGDVVEVKEGYARNCLLPQNLALIPTDSNVKAVASARAEAAEQRRMREEERKAAAERLAGTEITIRAAANAEARVKWQPRCVRKATPSRRSKSTCTNRFDNWTTSSCRCVLPKT